MKKVLSVLALAAVLAGGCKKDQNQVSEASSSQPDITAMKEWVAKHYGLELENVGYNPKTKMFSYYGNEQVSLDYARSISLKDQKILILNYAGDSNKTPFKKLPISGEQPIDPIDDGGDYPPNSPAPTAYLDISSPYGSLATNTGVWRIDDYTVKEAANNKITIKYSQENKLTVTLKLNAYMVNGSAAPFKLKAYLVLGMQGQPPVQISTGSVDFSEADYPDHAFTKEKTFEVKLTGKPDYNNGYIMLGYEVNGDKEHPMYDSSPLYDLLVSGIPAGGSQTGGNTDIPPPAGQVNILRLYHTRGLHFYTTSGIEREQLLGTNRLPDLTPSIWTQTANLVLSLMGHSNDPKYWVNEGNIGRAFTKQIPGTVPLKRFFNPKSADHMYTIDENEGRALVESLGFVYEGIIGYVYASPNENTHAVYRYLGDNRRGHFFTSNYNELGGGKDGMRLEGTAFYVIY